MVDDGDDEALAAAEDYIAGAGARGEADPIDIINVDNEDHGADLPVLFSIWKCPMINKFAGFDDNGKSCPLESDSSQPKPFRTMNATKALVHVAKVPGYDIRPCRGRIPAAKSRQYRELHLSKTLTKEQRKNKKDMMNNQIADMQERTVFSLAASGSTGAGDENENSPAIPSLKRPWTVTEQSSSLTGSTSTPRHSPSLFFNPRKKPKSGRVTQMKLCGNAIDMNAGARINVAIADFIHSHLLPFSLAQDPKLMKIIEEARKLGPSYMAPTRNDISGKYLDALYVTHWKEQMKTLLSEARIFGVTDFGDGATIKTIPLFNVLAACVNNPFALLEITDCTGHCAEGGNKDAKYIAKVIMPLINLMESEEDMHKKTSPRIVDLVFFDGASNVQNAGEILRAFNPRISVGHGAKHVVSLFFSDVYTKVRSFVILSAFAKRVRNIFGSVRHAPSAMFKKYTRVHMLDKLAYKS